MLELHYPVYACLQVDDHEVMEKDMEAINVLLTQELQAHCRWQKDGTFVEFTTNIPHGTGHDKKVSKSTLQGKIEQIVKTAQTSNMDMPSK